MSECGFTRLAAISQKEEGEDETNPILFLIISVVSL